MHDEAECFQYNRAYRGHDKGSDQVGVGESQESDDIHTPIGVVLDRDCLAFYNFSFYHTSF
jgi:hypothetical protein